MAIRMLQIPSHLGTSISYGVPDGPPAEIERTNRIVSAFFGFDPEFVEERSLHLVCFGWLPLMRAVAQCRSPSSGSCYNIHRLFFDLILRFPVVAHYCRLLPCVCED